MKKKNLYKNNNGYTILETMVATSLFLVVVVLGMTSLLNASTIHKKSQDMRSIMDNLSFIMDDISKNLRTGYDFHCIDDSDTTATDPYSCSEGKGVSFKASSGEQWVYVIYEDDSLRKSVSGGENNSFFTLSVPEITIDSISSFSVIGAEPLLSDTEQPFVTIRLMGNIISQNGVITPFSLQTSVSQRSADVKL